MIGGMGNTFRRDKKPAPTPEDQAIEAFVMAQLKNADINISYLPDSIEKQIYINLIKIIIGNLHQITDSVRIELLNHVITLKIEPKSVEESE